MGNYYSGGLAEIVSRPSELTYSYFKKWFTGHESVGRAMKLLGLPCEQIDLPFLELVQGELLINLDHEERTLYDKTIFSYKKQVEVQVLPQLTISLKKIFHPFYVFNSLKILLVQSHWIVSPEKAKEMANNLLQSIPDQAPGKNAEEIIIKQALPSLIAIGIIAEFFQQLLYKEHAKDIEGIKMQMARSVSARDWFFLSLADQVKVKKGEMSFKKYLDTYGLRADKDYELTSPRWYEIPNVIKKRIENSPTRKIKEDVDSNITNKKIPLLDTVAFLQILRSEAKRKTLVFFDPLRKSTKQKGDTLSYTIPKIANISLPKNSERKLAGKGAPVSTGLAKGRAQVIDEASMDISKNVIGIFPNASPEFATQYLKCAGMIFLKGGQTSHGAIVAREFGIPALIDHEAQSIMNKEKVLIDGEKGTWQIIS